MNLLNLEKSPYLLQHAHNPVHWQPWGEAAFAMAKAQQKPVLISIGYAACHWCHVMERESFEDEAVAAYMNEHFINIKVDKEEHTAVDHFFMDALQLMNGQGGWPLNMFATPDKQPFYGGTYFPPRRYHNRPSWMEVLEAIRLSWDQRQDEIAKQGASVVAHLKQQAQLSHLMAYDFNSNYFFEIADKLLGSFDHQNGGFGHPPKFLQTHSIQYLLDSYHFTENEKYRDAALFTLDKMLAGGIYDQLGGGIARYATDAQWLVPHFEKMLYDNALLIDVLSSAYKITKNVAYKEAIEYIAQFCIRELSPEGRGIGFYSALDADSEGEEGKFYVWDYEEVRDLHPAILAYYDLSPQGNWEGKNILNRPFTKAQICARFGIDETAFEELNAQATERMRALRLLRTRPITDTKIMLSWNALLCKALSKAGAALGLPAYQKLALENLEFLFDVFWKDEELHHVFTDGRLYVTAHLDDLAFLLDAIISYTQSTFDNRFLPQAKRLLELSAKYSDQTDLFYHYSDNESSDLPAAKVEIYDGATPSPNAVMAHNLQFLSYWLKDPALLELAKKMVAQIAPTMRQHPQAFAHWATVAQRIYHEQTLSLEGGVPEPFFKIQGEFLPGLIAIWQPQAEGQENKAINSGTVAYLCRDQHCLPPIFDVETLLQKIKSRKMLE